MNPALAQLAHAHGVATSYEDWARRPVDVSEETVQAVLAGLGIDTSDPEAALAASVAALWEQVLPPAVVVRQSAPRPVSVRSDTDADVRVELRLADGTAQALVPGAVLGHDPQLVRVVREVDLPTGLPLGDHRLTAYVDGEQAADVPLIVAPDQLPLPDQRLWGWMAQLYAMRTTWGMGDYADLAELGTWAADQGAGLLLVNPLHATALAAPMQNSPYFPASRRFSSPLYLRPEITPEYAAAPADVRAQIDALAASVPLAEQIDRDAVWAAKSAALEELFRYRVERPGGEVSEGLTAYATWSAITELHGADWRTWPETLRDPQGAAARQTAEGLADRVAFHSWLQQLCAEQLAAAQQAAVDAGMPVGIVHDLAVGVDPGGADAWALQAELATGFSVGAPPDSFNQQGQDWGLPPWRPDRLAATGYAPVREMVRAVLRIGGGLRIDHILGLFRLWWVPQGKSAAHGTYVSYDADAMLGVIALEAERAGGLVVGEDLGTVPKAVHEVLGRNAVLGSTVLWFERDDDGALVPPAAWREAAVASVTTHDLPTAAGFLTGEHVRVRAGLGLLDDAEAEERGAAAERAEMSELVAAEGADAAVRDRLAAAGLDGADAAPLRPLEPEILALHELLVRSPSRVVLAWLPDAVGDLRQPNMPGTVDQYPNWRLPVADADGRALTRPQVCADPGTARIAAVLRGTEKI